MNKRQMKVLTILRNLPDSYLYQNGVVWNIRYGQGMSRMKANLTVMDVFQLIRLGFLKKIREDWSDLMPYHNIPNEYVPVEYEG